MIRRKFFGWAAGAVAAMAGLKATKASPDPKWVDGYLEPRPIRELFKIGDVVRLKGGDGTPMTIGELRRGADLAGGDDVAECMWFEKIDGRWGQLYEQVFPTGRLETIESISTEIVGVKDGKVVLGPYPTYADWRLYGRQ